MQSELAISAGLAAGCILVHLLGLTFLVRFIRWFVDHMRSPWVTLDRVLMPLVIASALFLLHSAEVYVYALFYTWRLSMDFSQALYVSAGAYSTASLTYFDHHTGGRLIAAQESIVGLLLLGWSTAFLFATLNRMLTTEETHPIPEGVMAPEPEESASQKE